jgi:aspartate carbamoyltransferase regulatory subunit
MGRGWREDDTATGRIKRALRWRGRRNCGRGDCVYCQNERKILETFVSAEGKKYRVWVVCRYCEGKG